MMRRSLGTRWPIAAVAATAIVAALALAPTTGMAAGRAGSGAPTCFGKPATAVGTEGDDVILGTRGDDVIVGLGGNDVLGQAAPGSDAGTNGVDLICGGDGEDTLYGGNGADKLDGGLKDDTLIGGKGPDLLQGHILDDVIYPDGYRNAPCSDTSNDVIQGGADKDVVVYDTACTPAIHVDLVAGVATGQGTDTLELVDGAQGGPQADVLIGNDTNNRFYGGDGDDTISGAGGKDSLDGGPGFDALDGGSGIDTCVNGEDDHSCERGSAQRA
jgi:Ca2+-binding RTX toxin-like protein